MSYPLVCLGDIADFINGVAFKPEDWGTEGKPIIRIQNLNDPSKEYNYTEREVKDANIARKGDLLVSWSASLGVYEWHGQDACINQHIFKVVPNNEKIDKTYLKRALELSIVEMESQVHGATMKHITRGKFLANKIPLPPLAEQRRIASILDQADELRQKRQQAIKKLDQLLQATFIDMFGDPVSNPKGWRSDKNLGDVADIVSGITKGRKITGKSLREIPYLAVSNVQDKYLNLSIIKTIEASDDEIKRYKLRQGDLLLTEGGDPDKLGRGTLWNNEVDECIHQNHVFRVRLTSKEFTPNYLNWIIGSEYGKRYFLKSAKQTTGIASINMGQLKKLPLLIPPINLQIQFDERCIKIHQIKNKLVDSCKDINNLFSSLQNQAFSGTL
ncbi:MULTISPECIES: restriction endonuclease subunit S [Acinetobacter]|uniref:Restriction endonuclease subunit S n=15 Tax=Acinetobacter baumannii TaxID=470 RepID=A0A0E1FHJ1_ACIBA|nr:MULTISPECIES: restriction endonuclease subunit S [Acinetobacter]CAH1085378.1 restriction modification system DNA specificity domain-containing protein [Acinetobacter phage MD-2021a]AIL77261.1 restriction endonuclease subunit S [Acinetobacter baumannii]ARG35885.1 restriction endonuclease subunit S [Acinetobacter baumannii]ATD18667.1 restriction endonuclease subunit S [Acinetobacter baumannii]AVN28824.1 restriction endonuclease subunit S [Acinetobacter baumannii]